MVQTGPCDPTQPQVPKPSPTWRCPNLRAQQRFSGVRSPEGRPWTGRGVCLVRRHGSTRLVCANSANTTNRRTKTTNEKKGTKRLADNGPRKGLRRRKRPGPGNPKNARGQKRTPKKRTHGRNGRERKAAKRTKTKINRPKETCRGGRVTCWPDLYLSKRRTERSERKRDRERERERNKKKRTNSGDDDAK